MGAGHYSSPGGGGWGRRILVLQYDKFTPIRLCNILTTPPLPPHHIHAPPTPHTHTHSLAAIGSQFPTVPCLYSKQPPPPPPLYS